MTIARDREELKAVAQILFPQQAVLLYGLEGNEAYLLVVTEAQGQERITQGGIQWRVIYVSEDTLRAMDQNRKWRLSSLLYLFWLRDGTVLADPDGLLAALQEQHSSFSPAKEVEEFLASFWSYFVDAMDMAQKGDHEEAIYVARYSSYKAITALLLSKGRCTFEHRHRFLDFKVAQIISDLEEIAHDSAALGQLARDYKSFHGLESVNEAQARQLVSQARAFVQTVSEMIGVDPTLSG
jgi:uncharacterized protein (UPF0332 family)